MKRLSQSGKIHAGLVLVTFLVLAVTHFGTRPDLAKADLVDGVRNRYTGAAYTSTPIPLQVEVVPPIYRPTGTYTPTPTYTSTFTFTRTATLAAGTATPASHTFTPTHTHTFTHTHTHTATVVIPANVNAGFGAKATEEANPTPNRSVWAFPPNAGRTYTAAGNITLAASATDSVVLNGSANTTILVLEVRVSCIATALASHRVLLVKRSTNTTGGTSGTIPALVPHDSTNAAASAAVTAFTANPTPGTTVGIIDDWYQTFNIAATTSTSQSEHIWNAHEARQPVVLRGATQALAINHNASIPSGGILSYRITFIEIP